MTNLMDKIKILTGRKLSEKEMVRAKKGESENFYMCISPESYTGDSDAFFKEGDMIVKKEIVYELATTPDVSHGDSIMHTNYYPVKFVDKIYNKDGLLLSKEVSKNSPHSYTFSHKIIVYKNPGSFFGKESQRYGDIIDVVENGRNEFIVIEKGKESGLNGYRNFRVSHISPNSDKPLKEVKYNIY